MNETLFTCKVYAKGIYPRIPVQSVHAMCKLGNWYVVDQTLGPDWRKSLWSFSLFACMDLSDVAHAIWILKPVNDLRPANEVAFLVLACELVSLFEAILLIWKFMTWNTYAKLITHCSNASNWFVYDKHQQRCKGISSWRLMPEHLLSDTV